MVGSSSRANQIIMPAPDHILREPRLMLTFQTHFSFKKTSEHHVSLIAHCLIKATQCRSQWELAPRQFTESSTALQCWCELYSPHTHDINIQKCMMQAGADKGGRKRKEKRKILKVMIMSWNSWLFTAGCPPSGLWSIVQKSDGIQIKLSLRTLASSPLIFLQTI